jgi:hypothetical protein
VYVEELGDVSVAAGRLDFLLTTAQSFSIKVISWWLFCSTVVPLMTSLPLHTCLAVEFLEIRKSREIHGKFSLSGQLEGSSQFPGPREMNH